MKFINRTLETLRSGGRALGTFQCIGSAQVSEILAMQGFDWVIVDMEHGVMDIQTAGDCVAAIRASGATPFVRVQGNERTTIKRALDSGAMGVMVPMVNSAEEAHEAVLSCRYPPEGVRGLGPGRASDYGLAIADYLEAANREILVAVQVEHPAAVADIERIVAVPGLDSVFIGPMDLSVSMGHGLAGGPEVEAAIAKVLEATRREGKIPGIYCKDAAVANARLAQGFRLAGIGLDSIFLSRGAETVLKAITKP
jgi:2-keto-3-deoxy-L-rhamnonate aldolase RhmA